VAGKKTDQQDDNRDNQKNVNEAASHSKKQSG
jgi:hypothetical protein